MPTDVNYNDFFSEQQRQYWGRQGAGCIFLAKDTGRILLAHRSSDGSVEEPGTWGTWGGKLDHGENPKDAVAREVEEETGYTGIKKIHLLYIFKDEDFEYYNYLVVVPFEFTPQLNWENDHSKWVSFGEWPEPMHFGLQALLSHAGTKIKHIIELLKKRKDNMLSEASSDAREANFRRWFGNSVVKDSNGTPLKVYHGTNQPLTSFSKQRRGLSTNASSAKKAYFFTDSSEVAAAYAAKAGSTIRHNVSNYEKKAKEMQKNVERLERVARATGNWDAYEKALSEWENFEIETMREDDILGQNIIPVYLKIENPLVHDFKNAMQNIGEIDNCIKTAIKNGNDGVILKNIIDPSPSSTHYAVFKTNQIKSATGNNGDFNPNKSDITKEGMDVPPAQIQASNTLSKEFISYIKSVENGAKVGFKNGMWYPHNSPEGGLPTIAYGHKVSSTSELKTVINGISDADAERLLKHDLETARKKVYDDIKSMFDVQIPLDQRQEEMLTDFTFNLGTLKGFPKFVKAVLNKDWATVNKEYKRTFKDKDGTRHELGRNKAFHDRFLKEESSTQNQIKIKSEGLVDDGIYGYRMSSPYSYISYGFEPNNKLFHLYMIQTPEVSNRNKGYAKDLLDAFFDFIRQKGGALEVDSYTGSGNAYIKHVVQRLSTEYGVQVI